MSNNPSDIPSGNLSPGNFSPSDMKGEVPNRQAMLGKVFGPAIALMVTGVLNVIVALWFLFNAVFAFANINPAANNQMQIVEEMATQAAEQAQASQPVMLDISQITGTLGIVLGIVMFFVGALIISGARKMKNLTAYRTAMAASILAMIPFLNGCCIIGLPIGIWSVVVLMNHDVKQSFR